MENYISKVTKIIFNMKTTRLLQSILIFSLLLLARQASANCMWTTHNQCIDIGTSNDWASSTETNCNINQKPAGTTKCCCADSILGCCEKKDNLGTITTANMLGENCQNITTASTTFFQDFLADNNTCKDKNSSKTTGSNSASGNCQWEKGNFSLNFENRCDYLQMISTKDETKCAKSEKIVLVSTEEATYQNTCCCPIAKLAPVTFTPIKLITPNIQIPIPGLTLTPADSIQPTENSNGSFSLSIPWISEYIIGIYNYGTAIAGILAAIILMAGGVLWLISAGDASKITQAKELITGSITGLIILISSYLILYTISPELTIFKSINIGTVQHEDFKFAEAKLGSTAEQFKNMTCATEAELTNGIEFYATGYFKMPWQSAQDIKYLCMVHMQGTCPNGIMKDQQCIENKQFIFPDYPNYQPCEPFSSDLYNKYFNDPKLKVGETIAGPINCGGSLSMGKQVCFNGKTYTIADSGGGIQGRRIDILSSSEKDALNNTKQGTLKSGACK
ncbi:MAG: hypothetical protein WC249_02875 [Patescibacteria group bacterium]|jgi:hypothetical protein